MHRTIDVTVESQAGTSQDDFTVESLVSAMYSGRDREATRKIMAGYAEQGILIPPSNPCGCRNGTYLLTRDPAIEVQGNQTSGEVEVVAFVDETGPKWISVGSDHCDRLAESFSYTMPKQLCPKPFCPTVWPYDRKV